MAEQCPNRGPGLGHVRDLEDRPDGGCAFCGLGGRYSVCNGYMCTRNTRGDYCQNCIELRAQHAFSHLKEGHRQPIRMCPPCEGK